jgi:hypothetical protein
MKRLLLGFLLAVLAAGTAFADGRSAAHNLFVNLARAHASLSVNETTALVSPTLVKGIYSLSNQQRQFVGFTNESGTIFGDFRGFNVVPSNGAQPHPMPLDQVNDLREEVIASIDYDKLPKVTHGNGGGRRLVMFSAVDCPPCKVFESSMSKYDAGLDSTFYVVPSSLQKINQGGFRQWQAVSRIWCADDPGAAWQMYWDTHSIPQARQCRFADPRIAEMAAQQLSEILRAVGVSVTGTPKIVREDGTLIRIEADMDSGFILTSFGPSSAPPPRNLKPMHWLTASADDNFQTQSVGGPPIYQQPSKNQNQNLLNNLKHRLGI